LYACVGEIPLFSKASIMNSSLSLLSKCTLTLAIGAVVAGVALPAAAGTIEGSGNLANVEKGSAPEDWRVLDGATLVVKSGAAALDVYADIYSRINMQGTAGDRSTAASVELFNASSLLGQQSDIVNAATGGTGLFLGEIAGQDGFADSATARFEDSFISGGFAGAHVTGAGKLTAYGTTIVGNEADSHGIVLADGMVVLEDDSHISGNTNGVLIEKVSNLTKDRGRSLTVDASSIEGKTGAAIAVSSLSGIGGDAQIMLRNGTTLSGADDIVIAVSGNSDANVAIETSDIVGHVVAEAGSHADIDLVRDASLTGYMTNAHDVRIGQGSRWEATGDSDVSSLALDGGAVAFRTPGGAPGHQVTVHGDLRGSGGSLHLNTVLNHGGELAAQTTDRLLIEGHVTTSGTTLVHVTPSGSLISSGTDRNGNGVPDANEGMSLVQVGGASRADAFALAGGYVAAGPWQYTLHAFGPGQADASQNALAVGDLNWDYRLANRHVCEEECDESGEDPGEGEVPGEGGPGEGGGDGDGPDWPGGNEGDDGSDAAGGRGAVVPQIPSYLVAPLALPAYGDTMIDGLHQRLGDIREVNDAHGPSGEVFARYIGGDYRYASSRAFRQYGYGFAQQNHALQVGGSVLALSGDASTLRAGWALDRGTTRVTPHAVDGGSRVKYTANGVSAWVTWLGDDGLYVDGVVGGRRYVGDVSTALRGSGMARIRASSAYLSVEAGYPFALASGWMVEPQLQLKHQSLAFDDFRDADQLQVALGTVAQTAVRAGVMFTRMSDVKLMPYGRLDLVHTRGGTTTAMVSSDAFGISAPFGTARTGNAVKASAGAVSRLTRHVQLYGEGSYQQHVGSFGLRGYAANLGVRVTF